MSDAGIRPQITEVRSGEAELSRITGAQAPSGIPVVITAPVAERPKRGTSSRDRHRPSSGARRGAVRQSVVGAAAWNLRDQEADPSPQEASFDAGSDAAPPGERRPCAQDAG
jgi:hypothetical protein